MFNEYMDHERSTHFTYAVKSVSDARAVSDMRRSIKGRPFEGTTVEGNRFQKNCHVKYY
jgi:hypothetical protein